MKRKEEKKRSEHHDGSQEQGENVDACGRVFYAGATMYTLQKKT